MVPFHFHVQERQHLFEKQLQISKLTTKDTGALEQMVNYVHSTVLIKYITFVNIKCKEIISNIPDNRCNSVECSNTVLDQVCVFPQVLPEVEPSKNIATFDSFHLPTCFELTTLPLQYDYFNCQHWV